MLGLLLIYFIWRQFASLAYTYNKSKWGYGILGVVVYYAGTFLGGICVGLLRPDLVYNDAPGNTFLIALAGMAVGIFIDIILYLILQSYWRKHYVIDPTEDLINTIGQPQENQTQYSGTPQKLD
jgi:hypothetical protein